MTGAALFRQVVACRWAAGLGDQAKEAFRTGLQGLRGSPGSPARAPVTTRPTSPDDPSRAAQIDLFGAALT
jgi:hypothetical protein